MRDKSCAFYFPGSASLRRDLILTAPDVLRFPTAIELPSPVAALRRHDFVAPEKGGLARAEAVIRGRGRTQANHPLLPSRRPEPLAMSDALDVVLSNKTALLAEQDCNPPVAMQLMHSRLPLSPRI